MLSIGLCHECACSETTLHLRSFEIDKVLELVQHPALVDDVGRWQNWLSFMGKVTFYTISTSGLVNEIQE